MPKKKTKTHRTIPFFMSLMILAGLVFGYSLTEGSSPLVNLSSESHDLGELYIVPGEIELNVGASETFSAHIEEASNTLNPFSNWSVFRDDEEATDIELDDCVGAAECTLHTGSIAGEVVLMAEFQNKIASTTLDIINNEVVLGYSDEVPEWAEVDIAILADREIMMGYADGSFGAEDPVTRGQFITLLYRLMPFYGLDGDEIVEDLDCDVFSDLGDSHYAYEPVCFAYHYNWLDELNLGSTISPDQELTRGETAELFAGAIGRSIAESELEGMDVNQIMSYHAIFLFEDVYMSYPYNAAIGIANGYNIMRGSDELFRPNDTLNRAETAVIIWRILSGVISDLDVEINLDEEALEAYYDGV